VKLEFSRQNFEKYSNIKFHENLFSGSRVFPCARTDSHDEANSPFFVNAPKHISAQCGENVELLNVTPGGGTYDHG